MIKKITSIILCLLIILSLNGIVTTLADNNPNIIASTASANAGQTVQIAIALQNNPGIVSMSLKVTYDTTALTLINVTDGGILGTQSHKPQYSNPYSLVWVNDTATTNFTANGTIATLTFEISENAPVGSYPITVSYNSDNYDIYNKDIECVDFAVTNGNLTIIPEEVEPDPTPLSDFTYRLARGTVHIFAYNGCDTAVIIPETYIINGRERTVTAIEESAFEANETLESVSLPATIETIGDYAFYDCTSLTNVTLWCKNAEIGEKAFGYYYVSKKVDGKVANFDLTTYAGGSAEGYLIENGLSFSAQTQPVGIGDIDADGEYGSSDLTAIIDHLLLKEEIETEVIDFADINSDGDINILDLVCLKRKIADL